MAVDPIQAVSIFREGQGVLNQATLFRGFKASPEGPAPQLPGRKPTASESDQGIEQSKKAQERGDRKEQQRTLGGAIGKAEEIHRVLDLLNVRLAFSVDKDSGKMVIQIVDNRSGEVIRQIPPEERLRLMMHIKERLDALMDEKDKDTRAEERLGQARRSGLLVDETA